MPKSYYVMVMFLEVTIINVYIWVFSFSLPKLVGIPLYSVTQIQLAKKNTIFVIEDFCSYFFGNLIVHNPNLDGGPLTFTTCYHSFMEIFLVS